MWLSKPSPSLAYIKMERSDKPKERDKDISEHWQFFDMANK